MEIIFDDIWLIVQEWVEQKIFIFAGIWSVCCNDTSISALKLHLSQKTCSEVVLSLVWKTKLMLNIYVAEPAWHRGKCITALFLTVLCIFATNIWCVFAAMSANVAVCQRVLTDELSAFPVGVRVTLELWSGLHSGV